MGQGEGNSKQHIITFLPCLTVNTHCVIRKPSKTIPTAVDEIMMLTRFWSFSSLAEAIDSANETSFMKKTLFMGILLY